ncbi:hypothetical protein PENSUB_7777 [Penicillium subrubescens]|uniref:Uncharacterized protein n=1 Tax=Penicillium subrubescens TaxID=1316194 RepID=A0A1Q5TJC3_9EURO|nr:hypothetical protein PENSUB_7777 [Penicillium subrubescens]
MTDKIPDNIKRHWHGNAGDRHEHLNVWTHGGSKGPASRAAWALTPEMMAADANRRGSAGSASSPNSDNSPTTPSINDRRRSSAGSGSGLFSGLNTQKRESADANMTARRASWNEQREQGGFFSKLWEGYTRGK